MKHEADSIEKPPVGNLTDFVYGVDKNNRLEIEVGVDEVGKVVVFHNKVFKKEIAWFEFDLQTGFLTFVMEDGDIRDAGLPLSKKISKHMHNSHQILMVLEDEKTGDTREGHFIPLILHGQ